jgi:hypothetical protein
MPMNHMTSLNFYVRDSLKTIWIRMGHIDVAGLKVRKYQLVRLGRRKN